MADRFREACAVVGTSGAAEEALGEEAGGKVGGSTATEEGGANVVDGGDIICERNVSGDSGTDQLVGDNDHDYCVTGSVAEGTALLVVVPSLGNIEEDEASAPNDDGSGDDDAMKVDRQFNGAEDLEMTVENEESEGGLKTESSRGTDVAVYQLPPDPEDLFAAWSLVWGKVRSHPWWPGQIFDPSDASEKAMKYHKKESFLVAYFGDRTFAWNETSQLKPFRSYFSDAVKQGNSEGFQNAVDCALEEVSRRVELGLACSCVSEDVFDKIKVQVVENAGIRPDSCTIVGVENSVHASTFRPKEFIQYLKGLALSASSGADRLGLVIAKAQLLVIYRHKGFSQLPKFESFGDLEEDAEALDLKDSIQVEDAKDGMAASGQGSVDVPKGSAHRRKHNLKGIVYSRRKERSVFELMDDAMLYSEDDEFELDGTLLAKRRQGLKETDESGSADERKSINSGKVSRTLPKPSFKIGECISRIASQMTRSPSLKPQSEEAEHVEHAAVSGAAEKLNAGISLEDQSLENSLSQLHSAAVSPLGRYSFLSALACFYSDFRNSVAVGLDLSVCRLSGKRKRSSQHAGGSSEAFEFKDMKVSPWTDRIIGNGLEDNPDRVINGENKIFSSEQERPRRPGRRPYTKRRNIEVRDPLSEKPVGYVDPNSPAELVLTFPESRFIPSEVRLNKTFKRFGTLNELRTELDRDGNRARVVFKKCRDAEIAYSSASKFNIFGCLAVNYQLNHSLSEPFASYYKHVPLPEAPVDANQDPSGNASLVQVG